MDLKPLPIAAALVGGGAIALTAGSAAVAKVSAFAPAGVAGAAGAAAIYFAKAGESGETMRAVGYAALGIGALLGWSGYQAYRGMQQTTAGNTAPGGNLKRQVAGLDTIVGYWIAQNVAPPTVGGNYGFSRGMLEKDMSGQRFPAAWANRARP